MVLFVQLFYKKGNSQLLQLTIMIIIRLLQQQHLHFMALVYLFFIIHVRELSQIPESLNLKVKKPNQKLSAVFQKHIQM